jgi:NodT family efflux transporter outer membrane factor (OMF) lipoprotein
MRTPIPRADARRILRASAVTPALAFLLAAALTGCAHAPQPGQAVADAPPPAQWQAPLPHGGMVESLRDWWRQFDDPLLAQLIDESQRLSPSLAAAAARIAQARAAYAAAGGALWPQLNANASVARGRQDLTLPLGTQANAGLQAAWEVDLFGGAQAGRNAALARYEGAQALWHDARVSMAAETANAYLGLRACEAQLAQAETDARSRGETSRLTDLSTRAGFQAPANAALARASAAQANQQLLAVRAQCDIAVKALVALTGADEAELRRRLAAGAGHLPLPASIGVRSLPADLLTQRPDLFRAGRELVAASADVSQAQAARLPRITLAGSIGRTQVESSAGRFEGNTWLLGPLAVTLPIFDGGTRRANVEAARARYEEANANYRAQLRNAVREVEEALVRLQSSEGRLADARVAADGFDASFRATEARYRGGLASLFELEDARRTAVQAQNALIDVQRERVAAWVALYRALGGGWSANDPATAPQALATP